jgi:hypothetical protein
MMREMPNALPAFFIHPGNLFLSIFVICHEKHIIRTDMKRNTSLSITLLGLYTISVIGASAQKRSDIPAHDSTEIQRMITEYEQWLLKDEMRFSTDGIQPIIRGSVMAFTERDFNRTPAKFKQFNKDFPDYSTSVLPLSASWLLKIIGVESRSTTKRMLLSNSLALIISSGIVKGTKKVISEERPDGKGHESFPSGHSSLAYVGATILHREFGHHSPWISIGGYATATASQILRIKHNRHWAHDTFVGAGIGVVSTNFAYFITDKILGESEINKPRLTYKDIIRVLKYNEQPSSITFTSGTEFGNRTILQDQIDIHSDHTGNAKVRIGVGYTAGIEGSWFLNSNLALKANGKLTTCKAKAILSPSPSQTTLPELYGTHLDFYRFNIGARYSYPFATVNRLSAGLHVGTRIMPDIRFNRYDTNTKFLTVDGEINLDCGISLSYDWITNKKYAFGFTFSYHYTPSDIMPHRYGTSTVWKILL